MNTSKSFFVAALNVSALCAVVAFPRPGAGQAVDPSCSAVSTPADQALHDLLYAPNVDSSQIQPWFNSRFIPENFVDVWIRWGGRTRGAMNIYGKTVLGGWMTANSIDFDALILLGSAEPNHSNSDYLAVAQALDTIVHDGLDYDHNPSYDAWGRFDFSTFDRDEIELFCPVFDGNKWSADPTVRAGDMVHEGWHAWQEDRGLFNDRTFLSAADPSVAGATAEPGDAFHYFAPVDSVGCTNQSTFALRNHKHGPCDFFYWHRKKVPSGKMYTQMHSAYQAEMEFLCDVIDLPTSAVQQISRQAASRRANGLALSTFVNGPAQACGTPTPILGVSPLPTCSLPQTLCTVDTDCGADHPGDICSSGCCATPVLIPPPGSCDTEACSMNADCQADFPGYDCLSVTIDGTATHCCGVFLH
jgi:hypothetical protein